MRSASRSSRSGRSCGCASTASPGLPTARRPSTSRVARAWRSSGPRGPWRTSGLGGGWILGGGVGGEPRERLLRGAGPASLVMLNRYPYASAHVMVAPRRHTASLADLPPDEYQDLGETLRRAQRTLGDVLHAEGFN